MWNALATMFQYRGEIVLWAVWGIVFPAVSMAMWAAALIGSGSESIKGYARGDFAAYFLLSMIVGHVGVAWDVYEMGYMVKDGRLSPKLLRPIHPIWSSIAGNVAYKALTLVVLVPTWVVAAVVFRPRFEADPMHAAVGIVATLLGGALSYLLGYVVALAAFWTTRMDAVAETWFGGSLIFGGRVAPLALLPVQLLWVADVLPFKWMLWFPVHVLSGKATGTEMIVGLTVQIGWMTATVAAFGPLWRRAVRRYSAVGA
jgi:ABC-2 type transport system permease protein